MTPRVLVVFAIAILSSSPTIASGPNPQAAAETQLSYDTFAPEAYRAGMPGLMMPVVVQTVMPQYTPEAMRDKVQGVVTIDAVIGVDGRVGDMRISRSVDKNLGLDQSAVTALKAWTFQPGRLNGTPVPVVASIALQFRLH